MSAAPKTKEGKRKKLLERVGLRSSRAGPSSQNTSTPGSSTPFVSTAAQAATISPLHSAPPATQQSNSSKPAGTPPINPLPNPATSAAQLWDKAVQHLSQEDRDSIDWTTSDKVALLTEVGNRAKSLQEQCTAKQWTFVWKGQEIKIRDVASKLVYYVDKFAKIGDIAVSYDPHAAIPWAGFRVLLQFALASTENAELVLVGLEIAARCIDRCAIYERLYLSGKVQSDATAEHERALSETYTAILTFQVLAINRYRNNKTFRVAKSISDADALQDQITHIENKEKAVESSARLVDTEYLKIILTSLETPLGRIEDKIIEVATKIYDISKDVEMLRLPRAAGASFDSNLQEHKTRCLKGTRVDLLLKVDEWINNPKSASIFWLCGMAGTGKSTIARTIANTFLGPGRLGASFFFSRDNNDLREAKRLFTTLAFQLVKAIPALKDDVTKAVVANPDIADRSLRDQWDILILQPLSGLVEPSISSQSLVLLVLDALDECENEQDVSLLIRLLSEVKNLHNMRCRIVLTSRPELPIRCGFHKLDSSEHQDVLLNDVARPVIEHDIFLYFQHEFNIIRNDPEHDLDQYGLDKDWPGEEKIKELVLRADKLFIYAATICRFVGDTMQIPMTQLAKILQGSSLQSSMRTLDKTYLQILNSAIFKDCDDQDKAELGERFRKVVGSLVLLFDTINIAALIRLTGIDETHIVLRSLQSVVDVPKDKYSPIRLIHLSFRDFLLDTKRCSERYFQIDERGTHHQILDQCLILMSGSLKKDICRLRAPGTLTASVPPDIVNQCLPRHVQYACRYWVQHLQKSEIKLQDDDRIHTFLITHFLHWLEALALLKVLPESIHMLIILKEKVTIEEAPQLSRIIDDAYRFLLSYRLIIERSPLQIYCSALVFCPSLSLIKKQFADQIPRWLQTLPKVAEDWDPVLQTLVCHGGVSAVKYSPDGKFLASGSPDGTIKLWDVVTGVAQTLEGLGNEDRSFAFSHDSKRLATGSNKRPCTIRLWDLATGVVQSTLEDSECETIAGLAFSPDGKLLASTSGKKIRLWDLATGAKQTLEGQSGLIYQISFSPDGQFLVSGSIAWTLELWDTATGVIQRTITDDRYLVWTVAFSPDSKFLAIAAIQRTKDRERTNSIWLWDLTKTGIVESMFEDDTWAVTSVVFSPDGKLFVYGAGDGTIKLWDRATSVLQTLKAHSATVAGVAFSPDGKVLASASDSTVKLWDLAKTSVVQHALEGHNSYILAVAFSPNGKLFASASGDCTIKLWDAATCVVQRTLKGHRSPVNTLAFSPDGERLASGSEDITVKVWDISTGVAQTLNAHKRIRDVTFSPNGKLVASTSHADIEVWDIVTGVLQTLGVDDYENSFTAVAFSPNCKLLATASEFRNAYSKPLQATSAAEQEIVRLWDLVSGEVVESFNKKADTISFTSDGTGLIVQSEVLKLSSVVSAGQSQSIPLSPCIHVNQEWVTWKGENIIWLPIDLQPYEKRGFQVHKDTLGVGGSSGRVAIMTIDSKDDKLCV